MLNINGKIFSGTIINNARIINGQDGDGKTQKFNKTKQVDSQNVETISINSTFADVTISTSKNTFIEVHIYGTAVLDGELNFDIQLVKDEIKIISKFSGTRCFNSNLKLDVNIPYKTFNKIVTRSTSANINLGDVSAEQIKIHTVSGDVETYANTRNMSIITTSGDVEVYTSPKNEDIDLYISTTSGDVLVQLNKIGHLNLSTDSVSGKIKNTHKLNGEFTADVDIITASGNIKIL